MSEIHINANCPKCRTRIPLAIEGLTVENSAECKCYACGRVFQIRGRDYLRKAAQAPPAFRMREHLHVG